MAREKDMKVRGRAQWARAAAPQQARPDIVATTDRDLAEALAARSKGLSTLAAPSDQRGPSQDPKGRLALRVALIEPPESDPTGYERIIGESDLTSINYLDRGRRAASAVCRIRAPSEGGEWYGTGFLVGPRLLVTNHHVLGNADEASQAEAEFGYEHDVDGVLRTPIQFNLRPHEIFFTDPNLDVTFVAVAPLSEGGVPLERYGWLQLLPPSGKGVDKEWVTIVQHPERRSQANLDPVQPHRRAAERRRCRGNSRQFHSLPDRHRAWLIRLSSSERSMAGGRAAPQGRPGARQGQQEDRRADALHRQRRRPHQCNPREARRPALRERPCRLGT